jgi:integrase/recombinase XerD
MKPKFQSHLADVLEEFLAFKRSLGRSYRRAEFFLRSFDQWATTRKTASFQSLLASWLARREGRKARTVAIELSAIREFSRFCRRRDPNWFVPGTDWLPRAATRVKFLPHIFSVEEVRLLVQQADGLAGPPLQRLTFRTVLLTLYCTGLRFGEPFRMRMCDLDLRTRTVVVSSKGRTRRVPFRKDLARELAKYLRQRRTIGSDSPQSLFFVQANGRPYTVQAASTVVRRMLRQTGLKPPRGRTGPRPYDFRATFAVHRLTRWYRAGVDIHARLPFLSAYMGHKDVLGTEAYLPATPELLQLATRRFLARVQSNRSPR